jgi:hypothetical protein
MIFSLNSGQGVALGDVLRVFYERDLFESSYATRLNRNMGLYFGLRS